MKYNYIDIGNRIRENRKRVGIKSQDKLIDRLKEYDVCIGRNSLSNIENGVHGETIGLDLLAALCEIFDCDIGYLLCEYDERHHITADVCKVTGLSETAAQFLRDCGELANSGLDDYISYISMISELLKEEAFLGSSFIREAREYILIRFANDNTPVEIPIKDSDGYTVEYSTTTSGLVDLVRQRALYKYGQALDKIRMRGQKDWAEYRGEK